MKFNLSHILPTLALLLSPVLSQSPTATLPDGTLITGLTSSSLTTYLGIPYAQPPLGDLRLRPPQRLTGGLNNTIDGTIPAAPCPQFNFTSPDIPGLGGSILGIEPSEDCLTLNVVIPEGTQPGDDLPVVFWIFGGAFATGWSGLFNGSTYVADSILLDKPIIWVAVNYRVGGFGLLPGKEMLEEGSTNLAIRDQRMALEWVADNIAAFGGDPEKVTLYGESAGAISVSLQMSLFGGNNRYKGKELFRAAIMDSGSNIPYDYYDVPQAQAVFDQVASAAGCAGEEKIVDCLRALPFDELSDAFQVVPGPFDYNGGQLSYAPRADNDAIPQPVDILSSQGLYAKVPFIIGNQQDEGTLFSQVQSNLSSTEDLVTYLNTFYFPSAPNGTVAAFVSTYPDDPTQGSPYDTGLLNIEYPQYKRLAAILGDQLFTLQRRRTLALNEVNQGAQTWAYQAEYFYGTPVLGTFHASDILHGFDLLGDTNPKALQHAYYLSFVNTLDPNNGTDAAYTVWPAWTEAGRELLLMDNTETYVVGVDDFREESYQFLLENIENLRT